MSQLSKTARLPVVGKVRVNFYDLAEKCLFLYEKCHEFERQKKVRHLGIIPSVFEGVSHTRYEYLLLQCALCDIADLFQKGTHSRQGSITINGINTSGNALLKTWFMLSNFGHCKHTVSDEKALISHALRSSRFKNDLLQPIKDLTVKEWCRNVIYDYDYMNFHNVIAFRRIYKNLPRRVKLQNELVNAFKLLIIDYKNIKIRVDENKLKSLKRIHDNIRQLSMIGIDSHHSHTSMSIDITSILLDLNDSEQLYRDKHVAKTLEPFFSILCEELYLEPSVLAQQKSYEISSLKSLSRDTNCGQIIEKALHEGLSDPTICTLKHFSRFSIPKDMQSNLGFYRELRRVNFVKRACKASESSLDVFPVDGRWCADFFINNKTFTAADIPPLLNYQAELIEDQMTYLIQNLAQQYTPLLSAIQREATSLNLSDTVTESIRFAGLDKMISILTPIIIDRLNPAFKELLWCLIRFVLKDKYEFDIESGRGNYESFGFYSTNAELGSLTENIKKAIKMEEDDKDRVHELIQIRNSATRKFEGHTLCCISRITIYDSTKPPREKTTTDIDGVVLKISKSTTTLEFHESKNMKRNAESTAVSELRKKLVPTLNENAKGYRVKEVKGYGGKIIIKFSK